MSAHRFVIPALFLLAACSPPASAPNAQALPPAPLAEPGARVPTDAASMKMSFAPVVKKAAPAVVNVYSRRVVRQQVDPFFQMFGGGMGLSRDRIAQSLGSGVIVRPDGVIVTNNHVIEGGSDIMVVLGDRRVELAAGDADECEDLVARAEDTIVTRRYVLPPGKTLNGYGAAQP